MSETTTKTETWRNAPNHSNRALDGIFEIATAIHPDWVNHQARDLIYEIMIRSLDQSNETHWPILEAWKAK